MTRHFRARAGVFFAAVQGEGVVMDLVEDRYLGLGAESAALWQAMQRGVSDECLADVLRPLLSATEAERAASLVTAQLQAWEQAKLVSSAPMETAGVPEGRPSGTPASAGLDALTLDATRFSLRAWLRLRSARRWCSSALRRQGIGHVLKELQSIPVGSCQDIGATLHSTVRTYRTVRRLVDQGKDDCLARSLTLATALRRAGIDAHVCFGVQKFPFLAHAWVEADGRVVNDQPSTIEKYCIMARF